jgi:AP endonuclease family 2 C terminus.
LIGYDYVLSYEYEDPTMSRLDGLRKTINYLTQLIIEDTTSKFSEEKD